MGMDQRLILIDPRALERIEHRAKYTLKRVAEADRPIRYAFEEIMQLAKQLREESPVWEKPV